MTVSRLLHENHLAAGPPGPPGRAGNVVLLVH